MVRCGGGGHGRHPCTVRPPNIDLAEATVALRHRSHVAVRGAGAVMLLAALLMWLGSDAPGRHASELGAPPTSVVADATPESAPAPLPAPAAVPADEPPAPSPFTSTAPRGAVDRATWPTVMRIAALEVDAPVEPVGIGIEGALIIPASPMDIGWYQGGAVPGEPGVALLTSHLDTRREGRGVFAGLTRLEVGDEVVLTDREGREQRWRITARTQHRKDALPEGLFARSGDPVLALVTCGGPFDMTARTYRDNVIVWAEPAS